MEYVMHCTDGLHDAYTNGPCRTYTRHVMMMHINIGLQTQLAALDAKHQETCQALQDRLDQVNVLTETLAKTSADQATAKEAHEREAQQKDDALKQLEVS